MLAPGLFVLLLTSFSAISEVYSSALNDADETRYVSYKNCRVYELNPSTDAHLKVLQRYEGHEKVLYFDLPRQLNFEIGVLIFPQLIGEFESSLREHGVPYTLVHEDVEKVIEEEKGSHLRKQLTWDAYYNYDTIVAYLRETEKIYPNKAKVIQGGRTYEGRNITGLKIKHGDDPDQPVIFIESGIHAREWITPATTTYLIEQLLTNNDPEIQKLAETFEWHVFPSTNPDGYHHTFTVDRLWRKTRSYNFFTSFGVDPNRNYDFQWNTSGVSRNPYSEIFPGYSPFSEIETRTLANYVANLDNLIAYIAFHSTAQMLLVPYSTSVDHLNNYDDLVAMGQNGITRAKNVNGVTYRGPATAPEILYAASGGSMDWVKHALNVPIVYTIELRGTNFHWPPKRIPEQGEEVVQMMLGIFEAAEERGYLNRKSEI